MAISGSFSNTKCVVKRLHARLNTDKWLGNEKQSNCQSTCPGIVLDRGASLGRGEEGTWRVEAVYLFS